MYTAWLPIRRNMPRNERFGIGKRIDDLLLPVLEQLREAAYAPIAAKVPLLGRTLLNIDLLRFFLQLAWESKIIEQKHYLLLATQVESVGKMTGGWRKGLLSKTPPRAGGERKE